MIIKDAPYLRRYDWKIIVVDEGHRLKNKDCILLRELMNYRSSNRLLLSGTPLQNNLKV
jgi:ATP-dependent DNA helicase